MSAKNTYTCKHCGDEFDEYPYAGTTFCGTDCYNLHRGGPYKDREWLYEKYVVDELPIDEIADLAGCADTTIHDWLNRHEIERRGVGYRPSEPEAYRDKEWLETEYMENSRSAREIADELDCSKETILRWLDRHGIEYTHQERVQLSWVDADERRKEVGERFAEIHSTTHPFYFTHKNKGYVYAGSSDGEGGTEFVAIHRLLATLLVDDLSELEGMHVHHKDGFPWLNYLDGLEVLTPKEHKARHM